MQQKAINPHPFIVGQHKEALDFIIANLPSSPTFEQLNEVLVNALFTPDPESPQMTALITSLLGVVLPNAYNGYVNGGMNAENAGTKSNTAYSEKQQLIIREMLDGIKQVPVEAIGDFISGVEESIVSRGLTYEEQVPLFVATASARGDYEYWMAQITSPMTPWTPYLAAEYAVNYLRVAGLVSASIQGALLPYGLIRHPQLQPVDVFGSITGSIGLVAGKVVWGWNAM